jgi:hypothetical protein
MIDSNQQFKVSPEDTGTPTVERKTPGGNGHKPDCVCALCKRIQAAIASGRPPKTVEREAARQRQLARVAARRARHKQATQRAVRAAIAAQVASGVRPTVARTAKAAKVGNQTAGAALRDRDTVLASLSAAGINHELLDAIGRAGLEACDVRIFFDRETGEVLARVEVPDHATRHKFWRDYNIMLGRLDRTDQQQGAGPGLVILLDKLELTPGHPPNCNCASCIAAWERDAQAHLAQRKLPPPLDAQTVEENVVEPPESPDAPEDDEE